MKLENSKRNIEKSRSKILMAARRLFSKNGFSGTSTIKIAKLAKLNEALIFYYFGSKEKLWQAVKEDMFSNFALKPLNSTPVSVRNFLEEAIAQRLKLYSDEPDLIRLIEWQRLEKKRKQLMNLSLQNQLLPPIEHLKQVGMIRSELPSIWIMLWLTANLNVIIVDDLGLFKEGEVQEKYINLLVESFEKTFSI